ncbi:intermembrane transport protein PqiB [Lichenicoccus sp.]|uniref:PqiB family protein n=1 Tax=Lichenicoccus sp. TaxID=2781899 RepID=UPI003D0CB454
MSEQGEQPPATGVPEAHARPTRFSLIWLIPIIVLAIGAYLGWQTVSRQGPIITIEFDSADGLVSGQTQVKHKAVGLGTVEGIDLSKDLQHVDVRVRMSARSAPLLTSHAKFWVVRPRLSGLNISGLETLVSGAFIAIDPGPPGGTPETQFTGLDAPPGVRSDEPGSTFTLTTGSIDAIGQGSPVFFRNITVGEVLGYKLPADGRGPINAQVFIKRPYDHFLRKDTRFWDVSGINVVFNGGDLKVQVQSLQALISGGIAFGLPPRRRGKESAEAPAGTVFELYPSKEDADSAGYHQRFAFVTYLHTSVKGLSVGSPVLLYGLQVGTVAGISLKINPKTGEAQVRVAMQIQPERVLPQNEVDRTSMPQSTQALVNRGMRAEVDSANLLTGASVISFVFVQDAKPARIAMEDGAIVVPSQAGGLTGITDSLSSVSAKLAALPIEQIGDSLEGLLANADGALGSPQVKQSLVELNRTMANLEQVSAQAKQGLTPVLKRLPAIADQLQQTLDHANAALASYGGDSDFHSNLRQTLGELNGTLRSVRSLTDYLKRHPSSLIFGRSHP